MKTLKSLLVAILFACVLFAVSPARAQEANAPCGGTDPDSTCGGGSDGSSLPIDAHIWLLLAAAGLIGTKVIIGKMRAADTEKDK
jgi:hypothetical protein